MIRRALLSVSDKRGLAHFAAALHARGIELLSTGGTARELLAHGLEPREVSQYTGSPELMQGRLKTLHPRVHGGLLGRRGTDDQAMLDHGIEPIDLLVVNLYPFAQTIARPSMRALASAIILLTATCFGQGVGPLAVGMINDALKNDYGAAAVRYSLLSAAATTTLGALLFVWAAATIRNDIKRAT